MKRSIKRFVIPLPFLLFLVFFSKNAFSWTHTASFEDDIVGSDGFSFVGTTVDRVYGIAHSGNYSSRIFFPKGDRCWDSCLTCGAGFNDFSTAVGNGDELWTRMYIYLSEGWDWGDQAGDGNWRKILRYTIGTRGNISIGGYWRGSTTAELLGNTEAGNYYSYYDQFTDFNFPAPGQWFCLEQHVKFGTTDATTVHHIWLNGKLIFDSSNINRDNPALGSSSDTCTRILFFTYWNGALRTSQYAYIDDILITTDRPSKTDSHGNPMIGPSPSDYPDKGPDVTVTIEPPENVRVVDQK